MVLKRSRWPGHNAEKTVNDMQSPDEETRGRGVRGCCPCLAGWEGFELHVGEVLRAMRDPSRAVRAEALHVFQDAAKMHGEVELAYCEEDLKGRIGEKRAQGFRSMAERVEARRDKRERRRRRRRGRA